MHYLKRILKLRSRKPIPHFLGIGTQKGGTTSLYQILKLHPEVFLPNNKEIHYFTKHFELGEEWYVNHFNLARPGQIRGEITPYYLFHEAVPNRIYQFNPRMLLIVLLRDPVARTISQYFHSKRLGLENLELNQALEEESQRLANIEDIIHKPDGKHFSYQEHSYISRSQYDIQLKRYFKLFKKTNILILRSEDLFANKRSVLNQISQFLKINHFDQNTLIPKANSGNNESENISEKTKDLIANKLRPTYDWLEIELGIKW